MLSRKRERQDLLRLRVDRPYPSFVGVLTLPQFGLLELAQHRRKLGKLGAKRGICGRSTYLLSAMRHTRLSAGVRRSKIATPAHSPQVHSSLA